MWLENKRDATPEPCYYVWYSSEPAMRLRVERCPLQEVGTDWSEGFASGSSTVEDWRGWNGIPIISTWNGESNDEVPTL